MTAPERVDDVYEAALKVLQQVEMTCAEVGQVLPDRKYVLVGTPAFDCDQVTVGFSNLVSGLPDLPPAGMNCPNPITGTYIIDIVRELPQGTGGRNSPIVPSAERISETAKIQMRDAKLLADACQTFIQNNFFPIGTYVINVGEASGRYQAVSAEIRIVV